MSKKIWYVKFPTFQYKENVKELAITNGLKIVDAQFQGKNEQCKDVPKLTVIKTDKVKGTKADKIQEVLSTDEIIIEEPKE
jgi:hypothetical protein